MAITTTKRLAKGSPLTASELDNNFQQLDDLSSTSSGKGASQIGVEDAGAKFSGTTVESALSETATLAELSATSTGLGASMIGVEDAASKYASTTVEGALEDIVEGRSTIPDWHNQTPASYLSTTTFSVSDAAIFHVGRRIKTSEGAYGVITDVSGTTITVELSSGALTAALASVQLGPAADSTSAAVQYYPLKSGEVGVVDYQYEYGDPKRYGVVGIGDETTKLQNMFDSGFSVTLEAGKIYSTAGNTINTDLRLPGNTWLKYIGVEDGVCLTVNSDAVHIDVAIDLNSISATGVRITANDVTSAFIKVKNGTASGTSSTPYGVQIEGNNSYIQSISISNFSNTGNANGSFPQAIGIVGTADNVTISSIAMDTVQSCLVTGTLSGNIKVNQLEVKNAADNGVYQLGGTLNIDSFDYNGNEEPVVCKADLCLGRMVTRGTTSTLIGLDNAESCVIGELIIKNNFNATGAILRTRAGNTSSGKCSIGRISGKFKGSTFIYANVGTIDHLSIGNLDVDYLYDSTVATNTNAFLNISSCKGFNFYDWNVRIVDINNVLTSSDIFKATLPTTNLSVKSYYSYVNFNIVSSDEITISSGQYRAVNGAQALIYTKGCTWRTDIGPYIMHKAYLDGIPDGVSVTPISGTWKKGEDFKLLQATTTPFRTRCTVAGTPGTWVEY